MKKNLSILLLIIIFSGLISPAFAKKMPSNAEIISMQTRIFDSYDTEQLYNLTKEILEQNNFEITSESKDLGFISGKKTFLAKSTDAERLGAYSVIFFKYVGSTIVTYGLTAPLLLNQIPRIKKELEKKVVVVEANANFNREKTGTKIRISMIEEIYDNKDSNPARLLPRKIVQINNPKIYSQIFDRLNAQIKY